MLDLLNKTSPTRFASKPDYVRTNMAGIIVNCGFWINRCLPRRMVRQFCLEMRGSFQRLCKTSFLPTADWSSRFQFGSTEEIMNALVANCISRGEHALAMLTSDECRQLRAFDT